MHHYYPPHTIGTLLPTILLSSAACAPRTTAQRRWWLVSVRRCVALRQHQYQLRRANKAKAGDGGEIPAVFAAAVAPVHRSGEMGDQKVSRSRRNRCLWWGKPIQGVVYKGRRGRKQPNWGVCGCGTDSCFTVVFSMFTRVCPVAGWGLCCGPSMSLLSMHRGYSCGLGWGGLCAASLASTNITQSFSMNGAFFFFFSAVGEAASDEM